MTPHIFYIAASYGIGAVLLAGYSGWILYQSYKLSKLNSVLNK